MHVIFVNELCMANKLKNNNMTHSMKFYIFLFVWGGGGVYIFHCNFKIVTFKIIHTQVLQI